jgi:transposase
MFWTYPEIMDTSNRHNYIYKGVYMKKYRTYSAEFKKKALQLWEDSNRSSEEVAAELGISSGLLRKWKEKAMKATTDHVEEFPGSGHPRDEEVRRLRRQLADTKLELEILKKAVAIFSKTENQ